MRHAYSILQDLRQCNNLSLLRWKVKIYMLECNIFCLYNAFVLIRLIIYYVSYGNGYSCDIKKKKQLQKKDSTLKTET